MGAAPNRDHPRHGTAATFVARMLTITKAASASSAGRHKQRSTGLLEEYRGDHLRTGLRHKKELLSLKKEQVDLESGLVHIADSKTVNGIGGMPLTQASREAFERQMAQAEGSDYLFPSPKPTAQKP